MIRPVIQFPGTCAEAMALYETVFDTSEKQVEFLRDAPHNEDIYRDGEAGYRVMHASMTLNGTPFNFSDMDAPAVAGNMCLFNVFFSTPEAVAAAHGKLAAEGRIDVPLGPQFFSSMYGSVVDKFGIKWQLICG